MFRCHLRFFSTVVETEPSQEEPTVVGQQAVVEVSTRTTDVVVAAAADVDTGAAVVAAVPGDRAVEEEPQMAVVTDAQRQSFCIGRATCVTCRIAI